MKTPFKTSRVEGDENIMVIDNMSPTEVRFNCKTREIFIISNDDKYTLEDLDGLSWQSIKKIVISLGGVWETKEAGIEFLIGRDKQ